MLVLRELRHARGRFSKPFLTLGTFDGVHVGHQTILRRLVDVARGAGGQAVALTFFPHPAVILAPDRVPPLLTSMRARIELIAASGVDAVIVQHFTPRLAHVEASEFVETRLVEEVGVAGVVVGHRVSFGYQRRGNGQLLTELGARHGFSVEVIGPVEAGGQLVSSSAARAAVASGDVAAARRLLGRWPAAYGRVKKGFQRGRDLGFPTANLPVEGMAVPMDGVYATLTKVGAEWLPSVSNIGKNPTFGGERRGLEVHLLDRCDLLYGQRLEVRFLERLRGEMKFPDGQALGQQIARDVERTRAVLEGASPD